MPAQAAPSPRPRRRARAIAAWAAIAVFVLAAAGIGAALEREWTAPEPLAPDSPRYDGARAVVQLLDGRGARVTPAHDLDEARAALTPDSTLVVTDARMVDVDVLRALADDAAGTVLLDADTVALGAFFPDIGYGGRGDGSPVAPACDLPVASNAGAATVGAAYATGATRGVTACYPVDEGYGLVRAELGSGSWVAALDGRAVLANEALADEGNAALALGLIGGTGEVVWYVPSPSDAGATGAAPGLGDLTPAWVTPAITLGVLVVVAAALWRGRRFGPLVAERLPVTVRQSETLEGRARLYRAAGEADHAGAALRAGALARIRRRLAVAPDLSAPGVVQAIVASGRSDPAAAEVLLADLPRDEAALHQFAHDLRALERAVSRHDPGEGPTT
nr:DUF4350 domain-containing protein [Microbacterium sp. ZXX196]